MDLSKLKLPLAVVGMLISGAAGAGGVYASAKAEVRQAVAEAAQAQAKAEAAQVKAEQAREDVHAHDVEIAVLNTQMGEVKESLQRIERAVGARR